MNKKIEICRIVFATIILTLLFSTTAGLTPSATSEGTSSNSLTHAVFAEFGTSTD